MYSIGHVGIAMTLYAPIGYYLLRRERDATAIAGTFVVAGATLLPDVDQWIAVVDHRGATHSVAFAVALGLTAGLVAAVVGSRSRRRRTTLRWGAFGFYLGTFAVIAHLLGDVITPMGIRPFYPLSDATYSLRLVYASDPTANARLFALGCFATATQFLLGSRDASPGSGWPSPRRTIAAAVEYVRSESRDAPTRPR